MTLNKVLGVLFVSIAKIDCAGVRDFESLHDEFQRVFEFAEYYGRNMNAWIDCMTYLDDPEAKMTGVHVEPNKVLTIELIGARELRTNRPELYAAIVEFSSFVNWRRIEVGESPVIALAMQE